MKTIRVAIVEDDKVTREGLAGLIAVSEGFELAGAFRSVEDAMTSGMDRPGVLLLDVQLPGISGPRGIAGFLQRWPDLKIVMLTVFEESEHIFESICEGACGYLLKHTERHRLLESIREAHEGGAPMTPAIARRMLDLFRANTRKAARARVLSDKETEVVTLLAEGYSYAGIAARLDISENTVRNHIRSIYDKLHVHTSSEAVSKAVRERLIQ